MKIFVTGGTGFIGKHVVRRLIARGDTVYALARSDKSATLLAGLGAHIVYGDITDKDSMRDGMFGSDIVLHIAGWYELGIENQTQMALINVEGAKNVLELAYELGVPRIVHTSSIIVLGDTLGRVVDETFFQGSPFGSVYRRTKWEAHYEIALPLIAKGAPIIIVMPGAVFGPQDHSMVAFLMRTFYRGLLCIVPGADMTLSYTYVEDVADGLVLAADKGQIGESYVLTGIALTTMEATRLWAEVTGKRPPLAGVSGRTLRPIASLLGALGHFVRLPSILSYEALRALEVTYAARSDKAREQLGWQPCTLRAGFEQTFKWVAEETKTNPIIKPKTIHYFLIALVLLILIKPSWKRSRSQDGKKNK